MCVQQACFRETEALEIGENVYDGQKELQDYQHHSKSNSCLPGTGIRKSMVREGMRSRMKCS